MSDPSLSDRSSPGVTSHGHRDVSDYIEKITYAIWNRPGRDPELVSRYYGPSTTIQTDGGDILGAQQVIDNTQARLRAFPDFDGVIADTVWTGSEATGYRTSMRWTWTATNTSSTVFGPATGKPAQHSAIANCVIEGDQIVDEWLSSNTLSLVRQLGFSEQHAVTSWKASDPGPVSGKRPSWNVTPDGPGSTVAELLDGVFNRRDLSVVEHGYSQGATQQRGIDRSSPSRAGIRHWYEQWLDRCPALSWSVDDSYWLPAEDQRPARVATQWTLHGETYDAPFRIAGISHHHVQEGRVVAEWTEYDQLALLAQCQQTF